MSQIQVLVPDIGDFDEVEVIEVLVGKGDRVEVEDSLITLESDKATMEIPSPAAGRVEEVSVQLGDLVSEGSALLVLEVAEDAVPAEPESAEPEPTAPVVETPVPVASAPARRRAASRESARPQASA
jgi:pyruvate/2-oxoglutarate dehydrogenase complex dihydrolipoamide acyltransferase (E2) component